MEGGECVETIKLYHRSVETEETTYQLEYSLLVHAVEQGKIYGVCIGKTDAAGNKEKDCVEGLSENFEKAEQLLKKLADGNVFPIHLAEVCDDFLSVDVSEKECINGTDCILK